jgi:hypothetical protein
MPLVEEEFFYYGAQKCLRSCVVNKSSPLSLGLTPWKTVINQEVSQLWVLRRIFRLEREEVAGGWRRLHNEELPNLYASPNIIRMAK